MSGAIGPGDWVVCVDGSGDDPFDPPEVQTGRVYLVLAVNPSIPDQLCLYDGCDDAALVISGTSDAEDCGHCPNRFRPFHGKEESSLGLSRKLPTCEPVS